MVAIQDLLLCIHEDDREWFGTKYSLLARPLFLHRPSEFKKDDEGENWLGLTPFTSVTQQFTAHIIIWIEGHSTRQRYILILELAT
jgi:hypothetical protein